MNSALITAYSASRRDFILPDVSLKNSIVVYRKQQYCGIQCLISLSFSSDKKKKKKNKKAKRKEKATPNMEYINKK